MKKGIILTFILIPAIALVAFSVPKGAMQKQSTCMNWSGKAYENGQHVASFSMTSDCKFVLDDHEYDEHHRGTYSMSNAIEKKGDEAIITLYSNDGSTGLAKMVWPLQQGICVIMDDLLFK